jgi:Na+/phosphate symporter
MTGVFITTLGGLGMFILGMKMMTEGLQMSAGKRIKAILSAVSSNRWWDASPAPLSPPWFNPHPPPP